MNEALKTYISLE